MSIIKNDGFYFFEWNNGQKSSLIMDNRVEAIIEYVNSHNILSLTIQPSMHDVIDCPDVILREITDIGFLERMPNLTEIAIMDVTDCDVGGLYSLKNLRSLTISNCTNNTSKNVHVDFSKFDKLAELSTDWFDKGFDISKNSELVSAAIYNYRPQNQDFSELPLPKNIKNLELVQSNISSLNGAQCDSLEKLELFYCPKLETLNGITAFSRHLQRLMIENAVHLTGYEDIACCKSLESVVFANCGIIGSLNWVKSMEKLSHFVLEKTVVEDGDMKNLLTIDKVAFTNKQHYNCKCRIGKRADWGYEIVLND